MFITSSLTLDEYIDKISSWIGFLSYNSKCLVIVLVSHVSLALHCLSVACLCFFWPCIAYVCGHLLLTFVSIRKVCICLNSLCFFSGPAMLIYLCEHL